MIQQHKLKQSLTGCFIVLFFSLISCNSETKYLTQQQSAGVKDSVQRMMNLLVKDLGTEGPTAWLKYFEKNPDFFMASEGQLVFPNNVSATVFINNTLAKQVRKIELQWSNTRIDPLTTTFAGIAAIWHENLTDFANTKISQNGYFTAIAEKTSQGWQLRNAHWSVVKSK